MFLLNYFVDVILFQKEDQVIQLKEVDRRLCFGLSCVKYVRNRILLSLINESICEKFINL